MQSILQNLKSLSFLDNKIPHKVEDYHNDLILAQVHIDPIPTQILSRARNLHKLSPDEKILYFSEKEDKDDSIASIVLTTTLISLYFSPTNEIDVIKYTDIKEVTICDYNFTKFYDSEGNRIGMIENFMPMIRNINDHSPYFAEYLEKLIKYWNDTYFSINNIKNLENNYLDYTKKFNDKRSLELAKDDFSNQILKLYDQFVIKYGENEIPIDLKYYEYLAYDYKSENKKALEIANFVIKNYDENLCLWHELKANTLTKLNNYYDAILNYKQSSLLSFDSQQKLKFGNIIQNLHQLYNDEFVSLSDQNRKLILIDNQLKSTPEDTFIVLDKNYLPKDLKFPNNDPKHKELYIAHPHIKGSYLSFTTYEEQLSSDKFKEFFYFVQCLGANKITYKIIEGISYNEKTENSLHIDASLEVGKSVVKNKGGMAYDNNSQASSSENLFNDRIQTQTFTPVNAPHIPNNLIYYPEELAWHRLYQQRMAGGFNTHREIIISKSSEIINNIKKNDLKITFKNLFADAEVNVNHLIDQTFKQNQLKKWVIDIEFEPIENLKESHYESVKTMNITESFSQIDDEYLDEVKYMLEDDGEIDEKERRILERFRIKKGISAERAIELENTLSYVQNLSEKENEYLEEYQELINEDEITEKERRILNRMANRLGISEERVRKLED